MKNVKYVRINGFNQVLKGAVTLATMRAPEPTTGSHTALKSNKLKISRTQKVLS